MTTLVTRASKGSPLTHTEADANFTNLRYSGKTTKNKLINGDFVLARNAGPVALTTSAAIATVDNWWVFQNTAAAGISAQVSSGQTAFDKALKMGRNSGNTAANSIIAIQALSTTDSIPMAGKSVVLSFYAKAGVNFSGTDINIYLVSSTGTDQTAANIGVWTGATSVVATTQAITTSWVRYSFTGTVPSTCTQLGLRFYYTPSGTAGADDNWFITGVQLEEGNAVSDPEILPYSLISVMSRPRPVTCGRLSNLITQTGPVPGSDPFDSCHFIPYNGNLIMINGKLEVIPDGALAASGGVIANYSSCYVNKVAAQTLADNTFYFIYVWMNSGVMTLNFSTTGYTQNGATWGNAVKSDDETCTHVGICYINHVGGIPTTYGGARGQTICSYFNQFRTGGLLTAVAGSVTANSATQLPDGATLSNGQPRDNWLEWVQYYDSTPVVEAIANAGNTVSGNRVHLGIGINSRTTISGVTAASRVGSTLGNDVNLKAIAATTDATGYYYAQAIGYETEDAGAGTASFDGYLLARHVMV